MEVRSLGWGDAEWGDGRWGGPPQAVIPLDSGCVGVVETVAANALNVLWAEIAKFGLDKYQRCRVRRFPRFPPHAPWYNSGVNVDPLTTWKSPKILEFSAVTRAPSWRLSLGFSDQ